MAMAQNITFIPAVKTVGTQKPAEKKQKVRVAAYCRVSTEFEEQESSYETQVAHYTSYINGNPEWEMVEVYADNGLSGTRTAKREAFNRMIADCEAGHIDIIITKSISHFARNTVGCLKYTRKLKELNIAVFFEKENINTLDAKGEVLMTIMAALAQQESESLSANVRLGIQFRNQQGKVQVNHNWFPGYTKDESGKLVIVPEEAEVVRRIYREYLEGASFVKIRRGLEADGILNGAKHARWHETNIKQILTNEKYIGKPIRSASLTKSAASMTAQCRSIMWRAEAIIDRETFLLVQEEIARRSALYKGGKKRMYSSKYALSGNVACGHCGNIYRRVTWYVGNEKPVVWRCVSRLTTGQECSARTVPEEDLHAAIASAVNMAYASRDDIIPVLKENIESVAGCDVDEEIEVIDNMIRKSQMDLLDAGRDEARVQEIGERS